MKMGMIEFLPLCFLVIVWTLNKETLVASEVVVDTEGDPLIPGLGYLVWPQLGEGNGLTLGQAGNKTCPLAIIIDPSSNAMPVFFLGSDFESISTHSDLIIDFGVEGTICNQPSVWSLSKEGSGFWFVTTNGDPQNITSKFMIERLQGEYVYDNIYSFKFCPSLPGALCAPLGTLVDAHGTIVLAVGDNIQPYYVRFKKAFYDQHNNKQPLTNA